MNAPGSEIRFEPLALRRRELASVGISQYCVWGAGGESRKIKADTAYEAFKNCGVRNPVKIERISSINQNILSKDTLVQNKSASETEGQGDTLHDRILARKNPIISADELDELIRSLRKPEGSIEASPQPVMPPATVSPPLIPLPEPVAAAPQDALIPAIGMDVQGDGFDEIIPTSMPVKPLALKPNEPVQASAPAAAAEQSAAGGSAPERELSPEEVEKLLGGKS